MPQSGDLLAKMALGQQLTSGEINELRVQMNQMQSAANTLSGLVNADGSLDLSFLPVQVIYSKVLAVDTPQIDITIPSRFNNLVMFGLWRLDASAYWDYVKLLLNDDSGANYEYENLSGQDDTPFSSPNRSYSSIAFSGGPGASAAAGFSGTWFAMLPNIKTNSLYKGVISFVGGRFTATANALSMTTAWWENTDRIQKLTFTPSTGTNFVAGSSLTVLGIE